MFNILVASVTKIVKVVALDNLNDKLYERQEKVTNVRRFYENKNLKLEH